MSCTQNETATESRASSRARGFFRRNWWLLFIVAAFVGAHFVKCQLGFATGSTSLGMDISSGEVSIYSQSGNTPLGWSGMKGRFWFQAPGVATRFHWYHPKNHGMWVLGFPLWILAVVVVLILVAVREWRWRRKAKRTAPSTPDHAQAELES